MILMECYDIEQILEFLLNAEDHLIGEFRTLRVNSTK